MRFLSFYIINKLAGFNGWGPKLSTKSEKTMRAEGGRPV